jgi:hypothetical protein
MIDASNFIAVLHADAAAADRAGKLALYGQFVGDWETDIVTHAPDGTRHWGHGEIHFGWVLEGRAIQDVWMIPRLRDRRPDAPIMPIAGNWYGTTLRVYDPVLDAWRIFWSDPATNFFCQQIGKAVGPDIVQEGTLESGSGSGSRSRWRFTKIAARSFHWLGEQSADDGASWHLLVEVLARRV